MPPSSHFTTLKYILHTITAAKDNTEFNSLISKTCMDILLFKQGSLQFKNDILTDQMSYQQFQTNTIHTEFIIFFTIIFCKKKTK